MQFTCALSRLNGRGKKDMAYIALTLDQHLIELEGPYELECQAPDAQKLVNCASDIQ